MSVYVFGHRNPDTDAICAAIAYADLLQQTVYPDAIACCCGVPNKRTEFALQEAKIPAPRLLMDVRLQAGQACRKNVITASARDVIHDALAKMHAHDLRTIPVLGEDGQLEGILNLLDLLELVFQGDDDPIKARMVDSRLNKICDTLEGHFQHAVDVDRHEEYIVVVGAMSDHSFIERLNRLPPERLIVVAGDRTEIQVPAIEAGVRCVVVTGGYEVTKGVLRMARDQGVSILNSPHDTARTTMLIKGTRLIGPAVNRDFVSLRAKQAISDTQKLMEASAQTLFPVMTDKGELVGVLAKSDLVNPSQNKIILVDHNELTQAVQGADEAEILEVLDHHRLGGSLKSTQPIRFLNEPVGSTSTIVAMQFRARGIEPTPGIALCMASGIISDTLYLNSPTTTPTDVEILDWLSKLVECDLSDYAHNFFKIGSALRSCTSDQVVAEDCKRFEELGIQFSIAQIEEIGFDLFWKRQGELLEALENYRAKNRLEFSCLLVTDIVTNGSLFVVTGDTPFMDYFNYPVLGDKVYELESVVSHKKQLVPLLSRLIRTKRI